MNAIHRKQVKVTEEFFAPANVTFGFQYARAELSVWYLSGDEPTTRYVVLGTGFERPSIKRLVASVCCDGFLVFHLCEL
jgi:hypothetical protein